MNLFTISLIGILLYIFLNSTLKEEFTALKNVKNVKIQYNRHRRKIKGKIKNYYKKFTNKIDVLKIKYL